MTVILDLRCGVAGDMLLSALLEAYSAENDPEPFLKDLEKAASVMSETTITREKVNRCGLEGTHLEVSWQPLKSDHVHAEEMVKHMKRALSTIRINDRIERMSMRMLLNLLEAEMDAHQCSGLDEVHLHEAGTPDTIVDMLGISILFDRLEMDGEWVHATPVSMGSGSVYTSHGDLEVPVPAVRAMIRNIPARKGPVVGELATPTGVAAVSAMVDIWLEHDLYGDHDDIPGNVLGRGAGTREYRSFPNMLTIKEVR